MIKALHKQKSSQADVAPVELRGEDTELVIESKPQEEVAEVKEQV